jgi:hypothetical protein
MLKMRQSVLAMLLVILPVAGVHSPVTAVDIPKPPPKPTVQVTPIAASGQKVDVELNQPFVLRPGQTARVEAEDVSVTLRSLTDDSGCFSADDCSTMLAEGTLALQAGEDKELLSFSASMTPDSPFAYEFGDYVNALLHVEANEDGQQLATFVINGMQPAEVPIPEPRAAKRCPGFSRFDAAAILQADVKAQPVANLVFAPLSSSAPEPTGFCGYYAVEAGPDTLADTPLDPALPYLASDVGTPYAAVAGRLATDESMQLLHLLALVSGGEDAVDLTTMLQMQTQLAARMSDEFLPALYEVAQDNPDAQVEWLDSRGRDALWLALPASAGQFVAAIRHNGGEFAIVAALISPDVSIEDAQGYALTILNRLAE